MSQERAARALGWSFYRYRRLEEGSDRATPAEVGEIAELFGLKASAVKAASDRTVLPGKEVGQQA
jgi:transcriptional regulator with XRE-family HTH domain